MTDEKGKLISDNDITLTIDDKLFSETEGENNIAFLIHKKERKRYREDNHRNYNQSKKATHNSK